METVERILQSLFKRKKKKFVTTSSVDDDEEKENENRPDDDQYETVTVQSKVIGESKTFPRNKPQEESSPLLPRLRRDQVAISSTSLRAKTFEDPYDKYKWTSTQHFHVPLGTRPRHASSKGALSMNSNHTSSRRHLPRPTSSTSLRPQTPVIEPHNNLRRQVEPYDKIKDHSVVQHFHLPMGHQRNSRFSYSRSGQKGGMSQLVNNIQQNSNTRSRSPSMNNDEPIQMASYPSARLKNSPKDELPSIFPFSDQERKRRRSGSVESQSDEEDEEDFQEDGNVGDNGDKHKRHEDTLNKMPSTGIGKVFLDTIRKTEKIRNAKVPQIDPRSAARTPAANKMPKYRLRYDSPVWASPSRDTYHGRPWDSEEDVCHPLVLTSSGCASGCASDHLPHAKSTTTLGRSVPSLAHAASGTLRYSTPVRPGYTHASTMPHIRSVSGRIISSEVDGGDFEEAPTFLGNSHSGIVSSVNNSFSWATLAKYQETSLNNSSSKNKFFSRPELKHKRTILDM